jgi:hypothetical protein
MNAPRYFARAAAACAVAALVAACGSSATTTTTSKPAASSTVTPPSGAAVATITKNWETFFDAAKTPTATRVSLLENGSQFPQKDLAASGIASDATAQVVSVTSVTASTAVVKYNVLLAGTPALKNQTGTAVYQDGTWKVGISSFCSLLTLEQSSGFISSVPSVCRTGT